MEVSKRQKSSSAHYDKQPRDVRAPLLLLVPIPDADRSEPATMSQDPDSRKAVPPSSSAMHREKRISHGVMAVYPPRVKSYLVSTDKGVHRASQRSSRVCVWEQRIAQGHTAATGQRGY